MSGTCYGFGVRSSVPLRFTRPGTGTPLEVVEGLPETEEPSGRAPLVQWSANQERPAARVHALDDGYGLWIDDVGWYGVEAAGRRIVIPPTGDPVRREERLWSIPALLAYLQRGHHSIHAAAVEVDGSAVLLAAPGRHGKTTLATAFLAAGYRVLSEDLSCCDLEGGPAIHPGPAVLRVRRDTYEHLRLDDRATVVAEDRFRVHLEINTERRGNGSPVPLKAIILLRDGHPEWSLESVHPEVAVPDLWTLSFRLPGDEATTRCFDALTRLVSSVPVWNFSRPLTWDSLERSVEVLATSLSARPQSA